MITQRSTALAPSDRRGYALLVRAGRANQLSFELLATWDRLNDAIGRIATSPVIVEPNAYGAVWRFDTPREMDAVVDLVHRIVTTDDWLLRTEDRIEYAGWKQHEVDALVQAWRRADARVLPSPA